MKELCGTIFDINSAMAGHEEEWKARIESAFGSRHVAFKTEHYIDEATGRHQTAIIALVDDEAADMVSDWQLANLPSLFEYVAARRKRERR